MVDRPLIDPLTPRPLRLLVADDHPALRAGIRARVEQESQQAIEVVGEAGDGVEAVALVRSLLPDVALIDLRMPWLDGFEVLRALRAEQLRTRTIMLSPVIHRQIVQRAFDEGAHGFVDKESSLDVLVEAIRAVAAGRRYVHPPVDPQELDPRTRISHREREVLELAAEGLPNRLIAEHLGLGEETVKTHLANVMRKLGAGSRTEAVAAALRGAIIN